MLRNRYGAFIENGSAFEVTSPDAPSPWTNVVCNGRYGFVVSHNGGGFSWLDHCQLNVITRWNMDHVRDDSGRFVYLADLDAPGDGPGAVWSLSPSPCRPAYDRYRCVHRAGMTSFETAVHGVEAVWDLSVAPDDPVELWRVRLTNTTTRTRRLRLGAFFEWCCGTAPDVKREFHRLFFTTTHEAGRRAIVATKNMWEAPFGTRDDHWNRAWPHAAAFAVSGVESHWATSDKADFLGRFGKQDAPAGMTRGVEGRFGRFVDAAAVLGTDLELAPGETKVVRFTLSVADDPEGALALADRYGDGATADGAIGRTLEGWAARRAGTGVSSEMADLDLLVNHWLPYQAISARMWGRTGYYQQSGAYGFRDQLQDSQLWLMLDPARCREQILLHARHQFADGSVYHWWNPITETGKHDLCSDDYLWLPFITASYIRETGDVSILDVQAPFVDDPRPVTLREHGERAIVRSLSRRSERGLPLIGDNDWNDGLSHVGTETEGESVWLAFFVCAVLEDFGAALRAAGDGAGAARLAAHRRDMEEAIREHAWDGAWFRRATDRDGRWIGSAESAEGKIFLNAQTWAILTEAAEEDRCAAAWRAVRQQLITEYGALLLAPAYTVPDPKIGYLSRYAPGARENGGVYMHAATWALAAACKRRDADAVERIWKGVSPPRRSGKDADAYVAEPYVLPGNVDGPLSDTPGKAGWTWYTGSAAWLHRVAVEWVAGARATWEGLRIDPCPVAEMGEVEVTRRWRGRTVRIRYDAREFDASRAARLEVNGKPMDGLTIDETTAPAGASVEVRVTWPEDEGATPVVHVRTAERSKA